MKGNESTMAADVRAVNISESVTRTVRGPSLFRTVARALTIIGTLLGITGLGSGQVLPWGITSSDLYQHSDIDSVDMTSGNLIVHIPIISYKQRGALRDFGLSLIYNSMSWNILTQANAGDLQLPWNGTKYWAYNGAGITVNRNDALAVVGLYVNPPPSQIRQSVAVDYTGAQHYMGAPDDAVGPWQAGDGSGLRLINDSLGPVLLDPHGVKHHIFGADSYFDRISDLNGNTITPNPCSKDASQVCSWSDSVGRIIPAPPEAFHADGQRQRYMVPGCQTLNFPAQNSTTIPISFCYQQYTFSSNFQFLGVDEKSYTVTTLQSVGLPDGTKWIFDYDSWGSLSKITLPTGGAISYSWGNIASTKFAQTEVRVITSRTVDAGLGNVATWSYTDIGSVTTGVMTDPLGNDTTVSTANPQETIYYQGSRASNTPLKRVVREGPSFPAWVETTLYPSRQVRRTTYQYEPATFLVQSQSDFDWGIDAPGGLLKMTNYQYQWQVDNRYWTANILAPLASECVPKLGSSSCTPSVSDTVSYTSYGYDENNGSPQGVLGNQTSITRWSNVGASPRKQVVYNAQGMPVKSLDPMDPKGNNPTVYTYDSSGLFLSQIQYPTTNNVSHIEHFAYDLNSGQVTSHSDQNGRATTYTYDVMSRPLTVNFPDGGLLSTNIPFPWAPVVSTSRKIDQSGHNLTTTTNLDSLGRPKREMFDSDPAGTTYIDTGYDLLGRVSTVTNPYRSTGDATYGITTTRFDALGRVIEVDQADGTQVLTTYAGRATQTQDAGNGAFHLTRISQTDGLGRLIYVCEVSAANAANGDQPSDCGLDLPGRGFLTTYQYDPLGNLTGVRQGGITRSFVYDSLSRLLSASNPESGTICYGTMDASGTCQNNGYDSNGNLVAKTSPAPNQGNPKVAVTATYAYDALNRLTKIFYSDNTTPTVLKNYDTSQELGITLTNTIGRQSAGYVQDASGKVLSGQVFSYDSVGNVIDNSQCTPRTCTSSAAFSTVYSYDLLGNPLSASNGAGTTFGYSYDTSGRLISMTSSLSDGNHPETLISSMSYNPMGALTAGSLGSRLNESWSYDCRGRLLKYASAFAPVYPSAATANTSGCPVASAGNIPPGPYGIPVPNSAIAGLRLRATVPNPLLDRSLASLGGGLSLGTVVVSGSRKGVASDHGSVSVTITTLDGPPRAKSFTAVYSPGDSALKIAWRLARRLKNDSNLPVTPQVRRVGRGAAVDLLGRGPWNHAKFRVATAVVSDRSIPSIHAHTSASILIRPILLGAIREPKERGR